MTTLLQTLLEWAQRTGPELLVIAAVAAGAVLQLAVLRDRHIDESSFIASARRLMVAGQLLLVLRLAWLLGTEGDTPLSAPGAIALLLWAAGSGTEALERLRTRWHGLDDYRGPERRHGFDRRRPHNVRRRGDEPEPGWW